VLIGTEQLTAVRAAIRALDKLNVASDVYHQKLQEAQDLGEAVLDAKVKVGELALAAPSMKGKHDNRANQYTTEESGRRLCGQPSSTSAKQEVAAAVGVKFATLKEWQQLAQHPELVEEAKQQARESGEIVGSTVALQLIKRHDKETTIDNIVKNNNIPDEDLMIIEKLKRGETVVLNMNRNFHALQYAKDNGLYEQVDRWTDWGNPFILDQDGNRNYVCDAFQVYFDLRKGLHKKLHRLKGKALGCHCFPERCHADYLKKLADGND
jgi:hypothetical protein